MGYTPEPPVSLGLEQFIQSPPAWLAGRRIGLLCNAASLDHRFVHAGEHLYNLFADRLKAFFSPQHGLFAEKQDNMIESPDRRDPWVGIPVHSLYSSTREPTRDMMESIEVLIVDLQDVGTRVYTFMYTLSYCMEAARRHGVKVVVLDRPNPIGGLKIEGNLLDPQWASFVGRYALPMRHGLTMGELANLFNTAFGIGCDLTVIPMRGWRRAMLYEDTGLPWVAPSPNLPSPASAMVYPGQVIWEGTNVSEGRGTTQPFEICGAPFIETRRILEDLGGNMVPGALLRPIEFEPTSNKWQGQICRGFHVHVTDAELFQPYLTTLKLLQSILRHHAQAFAWKSPPYEYEFQRLPIDLILGDQKIRTDICAMKPPEDLEKAWRPDLERFDVLRRQFLLYT